MEMRGLFITKILSTLLSLSLTFVIIKSSDFLIHFTFFFRRFVNNTTMWWLSTKSGKIFLKKKLQLEGNEAHIVKLSWRKTKMDWEFLVLRDENV